MTTYLFIPPELAYIQVKTFNDDRTAVAEFEVWGRQWMHGVHCARAVEGGPNMRVAYYYDDMFYSTLPVDTVRADSDLQVAFCPFCGATGDGRAPVTADDVAGDLRTHLVEWTTVSTEDPDNVATLWEHQCMKCARSFWT